MARRREAGVEEVGDGKSREASGGAAGRGRGVVEWSMGDAKGGRGGG